MRALIIEDNAIVGADLELSLADLGFSDVVIARSETEAVEMARAAHPDLIVCDAGPSDTGVRAVSKILRHGAAAVVFIGGFLPGNEIVVDDRGTVTLGKPCDVKRLRKAISRTALQPARGSLDIPGKKKASHEDRSREFASRR